jgi:hypothetical protein
MAVSEKVEDTKVVIRSCRSKDRQYKRTNNTNNTKNEDKEQTIMFYKTLHRK